MLVVHRLENRKVEVGLWGVREAVEAWGVLTSSHG